jgi:hypothetical protein
MVGKRSEKIAAVTALALSVSLLIICVAQVRAESLDALYEKAKLEKTVALYGAGPTGSHDRWIRDFQQRFPGVTVTFTGGLSPPLSKRIEQQLVGKKLETDLTVLQTIQDFARWKKHGALLFFKPEGSDWIGPAYKDEDGAFTAVSVNPIVYAYNTKLVPAAKVPKSALDFLTARFQGQLITTDPAEDDAALAIFNLIVTKYGWDYMDKYLAQKPTLSPLATRRCRTRLPPARSSRPSIRPRPHGGSSAKASRSSRRSRKPRIPRSS